SDVPRILGQLFVIRISAPNRSNNTLRAASDTAPNSRIKIVGWAKRAERSGDRVPTIGGHGRCAALAHPTNILMSAAPAITGARRAAVPGAAMAWSQASAPKLPRVRCKPYTGVIRLSRRSVATGTRVSCAAKAAGAVTTTVRLRNSCTADQWARRGFVPERQTA